MWFLFPDKSKVTELPMYLSTIGKHEFQYPITKPEGSTRAQFFYNSHGSGVLEIDNKVFHLPAGSAFFMKAGIGHKYYADGDIWDVRWFVADGHATASLYDSIGLGDYGVYKVADVTKLDVLLDKMRQEIVHDRDYGSYYVCGYVYEFIMEFARQTGILNHGDSKHFSDKAAYNDKMIILDDYIQMNVSDELTMDKLCQLISVTPQHLCRIFKECTGMRPMEYIANSRVNEAKHLLINTDRVINTVSYMCGYENENYFWRIFKKYTGMTPGEYRQKYSQ